MEPRLADIILDDLLEQLRLNCVVEVIKFADILPYHIIWTKTCDPQLLLKISSVEYRILIYDDFAVLTCLDMMLGKFLYADPAFPNNLLKLI